jgi:hypothetical protein
MSRGGGRTVPPPGAHELGFRTAGGGGRRAPPRGRQVDWSCVVRVRQRSVVAVCAVAVAVIVAGLTLTVPGWFAGPPQSPLVGELERLRDDTGLFFRPGLLGWGQPSIADSAYGMGVLRAAGRSVAMPAATALAGRVTETLERSSVWGRWYLAQIEIATERPLPGDWYSSIVSSLRPEGYFQDNAPTGEDTAADLAATAAALDVVRAKRVPLTPGQIDTIARWATNALDHAANAYQACNATAVLQSVDRLSAAARVRIVEHWLSTGERLPKLLDSFETVLDAYGVACLSSRLSAGDKAVVRKLLLPALSRRVDDLQLLYYVSSAWRLSDGPPDRLGTLASVASARFDRATGLMVNIVRPVGTLENSYYVTEIRNLGGLPGKDGRLAAGARHTMAQYGDRYGLVSLLMTAVVLRWSGDPDQSLEQRVVAQARQRLNVPVTRDNVSSWAMAHKLLSDLGVTGPEATVRSWPIKTREDRGLAWVLLGQLPHLRGHEPPAGFADLVSMIPGILATETASLSTIELRAGLEALAATDHIGNVPTVALTRELALRRGCVGMQELYRPSAAPGDCDLRATADTMWMRTFLHPDKGGAR